MGSAAFLSLVLFWLLVRNAFNDFLATLPLLSVEVTWCFLKIPHPGFSLLV